MKEERLFQIIGEIDDDLVLEADPTMARVIASSAFQKKKTLRWALPAAAVVLMIALWQVWPKLQTQVPETAMAMTESAPSSTESASAQEAATEAIEMSDAARSAETTEAAKDVEMMAALPRVAIYDRLQNEGMGFGLLGYKSVEDLPSNGLYEMMAGVEQLPVYQKLESVGVDVMRRTAQNFAKSFGVDPKALQETIHYADKPNPEKGEEMTPEEEWTVASLELYGDEVRVQVDTALRATLSYWNEADLEASGVTLPVDINFAGRVSGDEFQAATEYLTAQYKESLGFLQPEFLLTGGDYNALGEQYYEILMYEGGDPLEAFLNAQLQPVHFTQVRGEKLLQGITSTSLAAMDLIGDYPILTESEAQEKLTAGDAMSNYGGGFPGVDHLAQTTIVYREGAKGIVLPYYEFTVEIPEEKWPDVREDGEMKYFDDIKAYAHFYLPAVRPEYLETVPAPERRGQ